MSSFAKSKLDDLLMDPSVKEAVSSLSRRKSNISLTALGQLGTAAAGESGISDDIRRETENRVRQRKRERIAEAEASIQAADVRGAADVLRRAQHDVNAQVGLNPCPSPACARPHVCVRKPTRKHMHMRTPTYQYKMPT